MQSVPREIVTPYRPIPLDVPEGMKPNEFFNSAENLADLEHNNGLLANPEGLLFYRKAIGHSNLFAGLDLKLLAPCERGECRLALTGYPQGLPSWEVKGGAAGLGEVRFWHEYDMLLKGFLDFYRTFFSQVSTRNAPMLPDLHFPALVEERLLFDNDFLKTAKMVRSRCIKDARYANAIRWQPAFKQLIYRNDEGKLIVTISQNSIGNAITELLGVVVKRVPDADAYARAEPGLLEQLLELRRRFIEADLGEGIATPFWPAQ